MKRTTKKLSGVGLEMFLRRFYASYAEIDEGVARRLSSDAAKAFASVRVRRVAWAQWRNDGPKAQTLKPRPASSAFAKPVPRPPAPPMEAMPAVATGAFDPYAIGLIPTFQREGADGLLAKLSEVTTVDNLRKMARSQQVSLPMELRGADADIAAVRHAIVAAVSKRIADRRAAAG